MREQAGLTQVELAKLAGVSRQLIGAVENGRHLPRVDAAIALATVLDVDVGTLFATATGPSDVVTGDLPAMGSLVRAGRVGDRTVTAPARVGPDGWDIADGVVEAGGLTRFGQRAVGLVVAGCEPGLEVVERLLREKGMGAVAASASSRTAIEALVSGRVHAAVVHGPALADPLGAEVERFRLTSWRVGLAGPAAASPDWWRQALSGTVPVVQREQGAGVQRAFESVIDTDLPVPGPRVGSHMEAAFHAVVTGVAAVTIEPAALALDAAFHPLETHDAELWVAGVWANDPAVIEAMNVIAGRRFQARLAAIGGYDLAGCGTRVA